MNTPFDNPVRFKSKLFIIEVVRQIKNQILGGGIIDDLSLYNKVVLKTKFHPALWGSSQLNKCELC